MNRSGRVRWTVHFLWSLALLLSACALQSSSSEVIPAPTDTEKTIVEMATATLEAESAAPQDGTPTLALKELEVLKPLSTSEKALMEVGPMVTVAPGMQKYVEQALADLAERLDVEAEEIVVLEAKAVVWPDGGLGCPEPGMAYTQVQVEGSLIRLRVGKREYQYHSGGGRPPFLCERPAKVDGVTPVPGSGNE